MEILERLLKEERDVDAFVRYLAVYKVVESNYGLFDKLARPRDFEDFAKAVYESVRVQDRVLQKLKNGLSKGEYMLVGELRDIKAEDIDRVFRVGKDCIRKVLDLAKDSPRLTGAIIASLSLAYGGIVEVKR